MKKKHMMTMVVVAIILLGIQQYFHVGKVKANENRVEDLMEKSRIASQEELAQGLIRFHVIANSDSQEDQFVKILVRDRVLQEIVPSLEESQSLGETRKIIENSKEKMIKVANDILRERGKTYGATATLGEFSFPTKYYGEFSLPAGKYEAFRMVLGEGKGANWWCVMFPPLCFVNVDKENIQGEEQDNEERIENILQPATEVVEEEEVQEEQSQVKIRWKIVEFFQSIF